MSVPGWAEKASQMSTPSPVSTAHVPAPDPDPWAWAARVTTPTHTVPAPPTPALPHVAAGDLERRLWVDAALLPFWGIEPPGDDAWWAVPMEDLDALKPGLRAYILARDADIPDFEGVRFHLKMRSISGAPMDVMYRVQPRSLRDNGIVGSRGFTTNFFGLLTPLQSPEERVFRVHRDVLQACGIEPASAAEFHRMSVRDLPAALAPLVDAIDYDDSNDAPGYLPWAPPPIHRVWPTSRYNLRVEGQPEPVQIRFVRNVWSAWNHGFPYAPLSRDNPLPPIRHPGHYGDLCLAPPDHAHAP